MRRDHAAGAVPARLAAYALLLTACTGGPTVTVISTADREAATTLSPGAQATRPEPSGVDDLEAFVTPRRPEGVGGVVTLAFAGDMHFELHLAALRDHPRGALGPITRTLQQADVAMVNLETSITDRGVRLHSDHAFRTSPAALDVLDAAGIDVVTLANNHAVDYGPVGLRDTLRAARNSPVPIVGIGANERAAFRPHRMSVRGTDVAFFGASSEPDQLARSAAGPDQAGIVAARGASLARLLDAVRAASERDDVVVVYLHWGTELQACPDRKQRRTARALADAGADVIVGSHAHVLLGAGWIGDTYVDYGLGNFLWYHDHQPESGVLKLRIEDGEVVGDAWIPALIRADGRPHPLSGPQRAAAVEDWRRLRTCAGLAPKPST